MNNFSEIENKYKRIGQRPPDHVEDESTYSTAIIKDDGIRVVGYGFTQQEADKEALSKIEQQSRQQLTEEIIKAVEAHHKQNTYEGDEATVYHTTIDEVKEIINKLTLGEK